MTTFTTEEQNLICLYDPGSREGLIHELHEMQKDLMPGRSGSPDPQCAGKAGAHDRCRIL